MNISSIKSWWLSMPVRDQRMAAIGGVAIVFALFYWGLWTPLNSSLNEQQSKLTKQKQLLSWMKDSSGLILSSKASGSAKSGENQSLSQVINATARNKQIKLTRVQPKGESIQVWIENVSFTQFISWLELLNNRYGVSVSNTELTKGSSKGIVNVRRLQLERK